MIPDRYAIRVSSHLEGAYDFKEEMREAGIAVVVDTSFVDEATKDEPKESIGVGCSISHTIAIPVVRSAMKRRPQLKYVALSSDYFHFVRENTHYVISVSQRRQFEPERCKPWSDEAIAKLEEPMGIGGFHSLIRQFSYPPPEKSERVVMIGGPMDGQELQFALVPEGLPKVMDLMGGRYMLRQNGERFEYHFANKQTPTPYTVHCFPSSSRFDLPMRLASSIARSNCGSLPAA